MKISEIKRRIKKNRLVFFTYKKMTDPDYLSNYRDYYAVRCKKSPEKVKEELQFLKDYWRCDPMHYFRYRLYEKDLSYEELIDYIPPYYFYNYYMYSIYGGSDISVTESKILMKDFFNQRKIETPAGICVIRQGRLSGTDDKEINWERFIWLLEESNATNFFIKPDNGRGGNGIFIIRKVGGRLYNDNNILNKGDFLQKIGQGDYLIQEGIIQRDDFAKINHTSVNTLRVVTQQASKGYRIAVIVMRIGRNGSVVDNSAQGGVSVNVDVETGRLGRYAFTEHTGERFDRHPDTGFVFENYALRNWDSIKEGILKYAEKAPEFPDLAWDIAVMKNGICAIEININYGLDHLQCCIGGMRRRLNISPVMIGNKVF